MVSIRRNVIKGHSYYYLVATAWVHGKSKTVWQRYLGTADKIKEFYEKNRELKVHSVSFGSVATMLSVAEELRLEEIIRKTVPKINLKLSVYQHILMQSICRFQEPVSKARSIGWYNNSILPILWKKKFSSPQTILNQFDKIVTADKNLIPNIEEEICKVLLEKGIKPSVLVWDPTNFFTYIENGELLPKKGNSKEKRFDKNVINLGLVVSDENIPMMHMTYEGNKHESKVITEVIDTMQKRFENIGYIAENLVFVFDKGNNSKEGIPHIAKTIHFVGSLKRNQIEHIFDVSLDKFEDLYVSRKENLIKGYRVIEKIYDSEYTIVVTYNESTYRKQKIKTEEAVKKIQSKFLDLEKSINERKSGKKPTISGVSNQIKDFVYNQYKSLFSWDFDKENQKLTWKLNTEILKKRRKMYGKNIIFTDLSTWETKDIVKTYNSKSIVEEDFKALKNRLLISVKPFFHVKDSHIRVHLFICVLAMILYRYMLWKLKYMELSERRITEEIRNMRLAFVKESGAPSVKKILESMTPEQIEIYNKLELIKYIPN